MADVLASSGMDEESWTELLEAANAKENREAAEQFFVNKLKSLDEQLIASTQDCLSPSQNEKLLQLAAQYCLSTF